MAGDDFTGSGADKMIPCSGPAFWMRLCEVLQQRFSLEDAAACKRWLMVNAHDPDPKSQEAARKRYHRWSDGDRPRWQGVWDVLSAINAKRPKGTPELTEQELMADLPAHSPAVKPSEPTGTPPFFLVGNPPPSIPNGPRSFESLKNDISTLLNDHPALLTELVARKYCPSPGEYAPGDVTNTLLSSQVDKTIPVLTELLTAAQPYPSNVVDPCRKLLGYLLSMGVDWVDLHKRDMGDPSNGALELTLFTTTFAEVAVARHEVVPCEFAPVFDDAEEAQGAFHLPAPAGRFAPMFGNMDVNNPDMIAHTVLGVAHTNAFEVKDHVARYPFWKQIRESHPKSFYFQIAAERQLEAQNQRGRRYYCLFVDEHIQQYARNDDVESHWKKLVQAFARALPHVRLVRLKGCNEEEAKQEYKWVPDIARAHKRT